MNRLEIRAATFLMASLIMMTPSFASMDSVDSPRIKGHIEIDEAPGSDSHIEALAHSALSSSGKITVYNADGMETGTGTGFFVAPDIVATNFHVIRGGGSAELTFAQRNGAFPVVRVIATDPKQDLALLYIPGTGAQALPFNDKPPAIGQSVYVTGNPLGMPGVFSTGVLSSVREDGELQLTAAISPGNSGGPVLDSNGNVIGVIQATMRTGQNLNFAIPIARLEALMQNLGYSVDA